MSFLGRKVALFLSTCAFVNLLLYSLFWLANFHLNFAFSLASEEAYSSWDTVGLEKPESIFKRDNFWLGYMQWLGFYPKKIAQLSFSQIGRAFKQTLHNSKGEAFAQRWLVLMENEDEILSLYSSQNYPILSYTSQLPPANEINQWKEIHCKEIIRCEHNWQVNLLSYQGIFQGYWGDSLSFSRPVTILILSRFPLTFTLGLMSFILAYTLAIPLAYVWLHSQKGLVTFIKSFCLFFFSAPHVILGLILLWALAWHCKYLPLQASPWWEWEDAPKRVLVSLILPALSLAMPILFTNSLLIARRLEEERKKDYILFARAKGLSEFRIALVHLFKPTLAPLMVRLKNCFSLLISGSLITENLFGVIGIGQLSWQALINSDLTLSLALANLIFFSHLCGEFLSEGLVNLWHKNTLLKT